MAKQQHEVKKEEIESFTGRFEISNLPNETVKQINAAADKRGIPATSLLKGIIHDYFNKTTRYEEIELVVRELMKKKI